MYSVYLAANTAQIAILTFAVVFVVVFGVVFIAKILRWTGSAQRREIQPMHGSEGLDTDNEVWRIRGGCIYAYKGRETWCVEAPDGATAVSMTAFTRAEMEKVVLPQTLEQMETMAFWHCPNLKELVFPQAFRWNEQKRYFSDCPMLQTVTYRGMRYTDFVVDDGVLLLNLVKEPNVRTPQGLRRIASNAFTSSQVRYAQIEISEGVSEIGEQAFCAIHVERLVLPSTLQSVAEGLFRCISGLQQITIAGEDPADSCWIRDDVLIAAYGSVRERVVPYGVRRIGKYAFCTSGAMSSLTLPDTVQSIAPQAFGETLLFSELKIPQSVRKIGSAAFDGWESNRTLYLPKRFRASASDKEGWRKNCKAKIRYY